VYGNNIRTWQPRVTDFAPRFRKNSRYYKPLILIRKIEVLEGNPRVCVKCKPVCDYGRKEWDKLQGSDSIEFTGCGEQMPPNIKYPVELFGGWFLFLI
jgi:hypothetical protein